MKNIALASLLVFLLSCKERTSEIVSNAMGVKNADSVVSIENGNSKQKYDTLNFTDADGLKQGKWIEVKNAGNSIKIREGEYIDNKKSGLWTEYNETGSRRYGITYINGIPNGYLVVYNEQGIISVEGDYTNGIFIKKN